MRGGSGVLAHDPADATPDAPPLVSTSTVNPTSGTPWRDLGVRSLSAAIAGPIGLALVWQGGVLWAVMLAILGLLAAREAYRLLRAQNLAAWRSVVLAVGYVTPAVAALIWLRRDPAHGLGNVLFLLLSVWASDIGAYLVGRWIGGPRLARRISPGKTWSGAIGGLASAALVGLVASRIGPDGDILRAVLVAALLGIASELGDLLESVLKRAARVKDSGRFLPGHGGLLDRLDGLLLAAPVAALLALAAGKGMLLWQTLPQP